MNHSRNYQFDGTLQEQQNGVGVNVSSLRGISRLRQASIATWSGIGVSISGKRGVRLARISQPAGGFRRHSGTTAGIRSGSWRTRISGREQRGISGMAVKPVPRLQSDFSLTTSRFVDTRTDREEFDVKILRSQTTYQFTDRLLVRNILEHNTFDRTLGVNLLFTYRVNAGTVLYVGYDDRYRADNERTSRAIFMKFQYLLRYRS